MSTYIKSKLLNLELRWAFSSQKRYIKFLRKKGVKIGENVIFHGNLRNMVIDVTRPSLVTIGNNVSFNDRTTILTHDFGTRVFRICYQDFIPSSGSVTIGNNVSIARNVTILKGVNIGDNCIIGFGSIITKDIPPNSVAVGVPARVVSTLDEYYRKRKEKCVEEAFNYARSISERFNRMPRIEEFWEEFPLFMNGSDECPKLPIKQQLGPAYEYYRKNHKAMFNGFEDFLRKAGL